MSFRILFRMAVNSNVMKNGNTQKENKVLTFFLKSDNIYIVRDVRTIYAEVLELADRLD